MKDSYRKTAEKRLSNTKDGKPKITPEGLAKEVHVRGLFAARDRDEFFDEAYGDILVDLFIRWLETDAHETKSREWLYSTAMALGSVKEYMLKLETRAKNEEFFSEEDKR